MVKKRSQNCSKIGVLNQHTLPLANQPQRTTILSSSSPSTSYEPERRYLDSCYLCQKKFDFSQDIYMYRDLAFCSIECRDAKIAIDIAAGELNEY